MPLYSYRKAPVKMRPDVDSYAAAQRVVASKRKPLTVGDVLVGAYNDFHKLMSTSKIAALIVPAVLVVTGVYIIYNQVWPTIVQTVQESTGYFDQNGAALVAGEYIEAKQRYSNPGAKYFADLKNNAQDHNLLFNDKKSLDYKNSFSISIPSLNLNDLKTSSNVDSSVEAVYDQLLGDGLAHFQGTSLPFSDLNSYNIVVYGHSSPGDYYQRTKDPAAAFSMLSQIRYGSEIIVKFEGKEYKYKFTKGKIVDANDLTILQGTKGQKQLTLFTCYPNGNNAKRFVAVARLVE
jgi:LPXTG-site transpeptidase (sortase) family protein